MRITKKRIRGTKNNFPRGFVGNEVILGGVLNVIADKRLLEELGFSRDMEIGEILLPKNVYGHVSKYNADGKEVIDKNKPKETRYREFEWCYKQWAGRGQTKEVCDFVTRAYERYHRDFVAPPCVELKISKKDGNNVYITAGEYRMTDENEKDIVHATNLLLEIFRLCDIFDEDTVPIIAPLKRLNWTILPPGRRPWTDMKKILDPVIKRNKDVRARPVIESRLEDVSNLNPDFTAIGEQGFAGYIVFGFKDKNVYVMESIFYGNAIYIFNKEWEELSKMTKAEVLQNDLQIERITHTGERKDWIGKIRGLLKNTKEEKELKDQKKLKDKKR